MHKKFASVGFGESEYAQILQTTLEMEGLISKHCTRMVPRRQVRHLGALVGPVRAEQGDWYARRMYQQGDSAYDYYVWPPAEKFGNMEGQ